MCINIERDCQSSLVLSFTIFIIFLPNHSTFMAPFIHSHIDFVCVCVCGCVHAGVCVTPGCLFANRVLQSQICVTGGPAGLQCVLSTSALLGEKLSHPLTQGNNSSVRLFLNTTTFHLLPNTGRFYSFTISNSQLNLPHLSAACKHTPHSLLCAQISQTKYQYL